MSRRLLVSSHGIRLPGYKQNARNPGRLLRADPAAGADGAPRAAKITSHRLRIIIVVYRIHHITPGLAAPLLVVSSEFQDTHLPEQEAGFVRDASMA